MRLFLRNFFFWIVQPTKHAPIVILRLCVGGIFLSEGIQKFLFADSVGAGRFAKIGLPSPELLASVAGVTEIGCGGLILAGFLVRLACL